ncbi:MAG: hypothetical protein ACI4OB_06825 [Christensenellales bacterium]
MKDLTFGRNGEQIISFIVPSDDCTAMFDELKEYDLDITVKKHRERRSRDANAYCWVLCEKLAQALSSDRSKITKEDVYRQAIREVGVYKDVSLDQDNALTFRKAWEMIGTGWVTERVDFSQDGTNETVRFYYGSSRYNTKQMSRLIDGLVQDCQAVGIETMTPAEIAELKSKWDNAPGKDT